MDPASGKRPSYERVALKHPGSKGWPLWNMDFFGVGVIVFVAT